MTKNSGSNTGENGGIYQEVGPRGGLRENYSTVKDHETLPPTQEAGNTWKLIKRTPTSKR